MSGNDRIVYNAREQLLSTDLNADARIRARAIVDAERYARATAYVPGLTGAAVETIANTVIGGLQASGDSGGVTLSPGMICQAWPGTGTTPQADESPAVIARLAAAQAVAIPTPGSDTYYLIQAQATETVTNTPGRNIWNPTLLAFAPASIDTRIENTIAFQAKVGTTTNLPLPDAGWIPICGVLRRSSGATPVASEIYDLRPLRREAVSSAGGDLLETRFWNPSIIPSSDFYAAFDFEARIPNVGRLYARSTVDLTGYPANLKALNDPDVLSPATALPSVNTWLYLYLCTWGGTTPRGQYSKITAQGIFVVSATPPDGIQGSRAKAGLSLPAPWALDTASSAICVGMVKTRPAGNSLIPQSINERKLILRFVLTGYQASPTGTLIPAHEIPANARVFEVGATQTDGIEFAKVGVTIDGAMGSIEADATVSNPFFREIGIDSGQLPPFAAYGQAIGSFNIFGFRY